MTALAPLHLRRGRAALVLIAVTCTLAARPAAAAQAFSIKPLCDAASLASGLLGKACAVVSGAGRLAGAGKQLLGGHLGSALKTALGEGASAAASAATAGLGLAAIGAWALGGAKFVLHEAAKAVGETTAPHLDSSWFSATYWRVAGIAALLTLPFLFAAAIQALTRSDLALLLRAVLGYLPLAMLAVTVAAPIATLLLSGSDELSTLVSSATGQPGAQALDGGIGLAGGLTLFTGSPFFVFFFALLTAAGAMVLWMELLMREAAVYVVVLMLPLAFAALVWPARRVWAIRAVETLVALILSKFAIVAVLSLGGAAVDQIGHSITAAVLGLVLVAMAAFSPWVLLRLVPLAEVASSAAASLRGEARAALSGADWAARNADGGEEWAARTVAGMRQSADGGSPRLPPMPAASPDVAASVEDDADGASEAPAPAEQSELHDPDSGLPDPDTPDAAAPTEGPVPSPEPSGDPSRVDQQERIPGLAPMWQAEDLSWRPLVLGNEEAWPPRLWPPDDDTDQGPPGATELPPPPDTDGEILALPPATPSEPEPPPSEPPPPPPPPEDAA